MDVSEFLASDINAAQVLSEAGVSFAEARFECKDPTNLERLRSMLAPFGEAAAFVEELGPLLMDRSALNAALLPFVEPESNAGHESSIACFQGEGSLIKALLRVEPLQTCLIGALIESLNEMAMDEGFAAGAMTADVPRMLLREIRWLEYLQDPQDLTDKLLEVVDAGACPISLQREILAFVPEIVAGECEAAVAEKIASLCAQSDDLLVPALDALTQLSLPAELQDQVASDVLARLEATEPENLPVLLRFLLQTAPRDPPAVAKLVRALRHQLKLSGSSPSNAAAAAPGASTGAARVHNRSGTGGHADSGAALTLDALRNGLRLRPDIAASYLKSLTEARGSTSHFAVDLWYCFCVHPTPQYRLRVEKLLKQKAESGCFGWAQLAEALQGRGNALQGHFATVASLAGGLLRGGSSSSSVGSSGAKAARQFGSQIYLLLFLEFPEGSHRQEVVAALVAHVGSGASGEADAALQVFDHLIAPPSLFGGSASSLSSPPSSSPSAPSANGSLDMLGLPPRRARVMALRPFAVFLKGMLDFVGGMAEQNVRRLFRCLFVLGDEEIDEEGDDGAAGGHNATSSSSSSSSLSSSRSAAFAPTCAASPIDDVHIVVRKFLALSPQPTRRRGIIGAVALLAQRGAARRRRASSSSSSSSSGRNSQPGGGGGGVGGGTDGDSGLAEWLFEDEGANGAGGSASSDRNKSTAPRNVNNNDDTCLSDATTPGLPINGKNGDRCEEWVTAPLSVSAVREVRDVLNLAVEACARDPSLLGFLIEELARAVEGHSSSADSSGGGGGVGLGVHAVVVDSIANRFLTFFQDNYIVEKDSGSAGTAKAAQLLSAIPVGNSGSSSTSSSSSSISGLIPTTLWGDLDGPSGMGEIYLQILPLAAESMPGSTGGSSGSGAANHGGAVATAGADSLVYLSSLVRLVAACELSMTGNAESIDAVLGCPIALADGAQLLEKANAGQSQFDELPPRAQVICCWAHKYAIDFVRDLVNVFVKMPELEYRWKVMQRLNGLCLLRKELEELAFRTPQFAAELGVRLGAAASSSSAAALSSGMHDEDEEEDEEEEEGGLDAEQEEDDEDNDAEMGIGDEGDENANPQKQSSKGKSKASVLKKANSAKNALAKKQKQKMMKLEAAAKSKRVAAKAALDEKGLLSKALSQSFRPLRPEVALVLAWPVLQRVEHDTAGNTVGLLSASQQQLPSSSEKGNSTAALSFNVARLLLTDVHAHVSRALAPPKVGFGSGGALAAARQAKLAASGSASVASGGAVGSTSTSSGVGALGNSDAKANSTGSSNCLDSHALMALYLNGGVFGSLHGLLGRLELALVDDLHDDDEQYARFTCMAPAVDDEGHPDAWPCFELLLRTVEAVCNAVDLPATNHGRAHLLRIVHDLAGSQSVAPSTQGGSNRNKNGSSSSNCGDELLGQDAGVGAFAAVFSRLRGFLPMVRSLSGCGEVLQVLEAIVAQAGRLVDAVAHERAHEDSEALALAAATGDDQVGDVPDAEAAASSSSSSSTSANAAASKERAKLLRAPVVALGEELSQAAKQLLQRTDLGFQSTGNGSGSSVPRQPKVLAFVVATHLTHSATRLNCLESWASNVLALMAGNSSGDGGGGSDDDDDDGSVSAEAEAALLFPTLNKANFVHYFQPLLATLVCELKAHRLDQGTSGRDPRALLLQTARLVCVFQLAITLTRVPGLQSNGVLMAALKEGRKFVEQVLKAMPLLVEMLADKKLAAKVIDALKDLQMSTRQMQSLAAHGKANKIPTLAREAPVVRKVLETLIYTVKSACTGALVSPQDAAFFTVGVLKARNVDGSVWTAPVEPEEEEEEEEEEEDVDHEDGEPDRVAAVEHDKEEEEEEVEEEVEEEGKVTGSKAAMAQSKKGKKKRVASPSPPRRTKGKGKKARSPVTLTPLLRDGDATDSENDGDENDEDGYGSLVASEEEEEEEDARGMDEDEEVEGEDNDEDDEDE